MPTSELSDALNPYYVQSRSRSSHLSNAASRHPQPAAQQERAIAEPARPPTPPFTNNSVRPSNQSSGVTAVQELMRFLASTRESQEIERKRRLAWEHEQEAKYQLRQAEMERRMIEMRQEIAALKARFAFSTPAPTNGPPASNAASAPDHAPRSSQSEYAISHAEQQHTPTTSPSLSHSSTSDTSLAVAPTSQATSPGPREVSTSTAYLPSPSLPPARFISVDPSSSRPSAAYTRKRSIAQSDSEGEQSSDGGAVPAQRLRRRNHHDTRCLTIQHAMRNHLLRVMQLESDKDLPDSHVEGTSLGPDDAVRFVWGKTPKQSVHNGRMKDRVLKDLKVNRHLYKHVPDKDFGKKTLDSVFDQAFVTLRQKFKTQRDGSVAVSHRQREDTKAMRARRLSRRKTKLSNRSHARNKMRAFEHVTFDGALQVECMSSEESESEEDQDSGSRSMFLRTRGFPWRSLRLQRLFDILDEEDRVDNAQRPRRGVGRKERYAGPPKEGLSLPAKGVASWMISKRWLNDMRTSHAEVVGMLKDIVVDPVGFDWTRFNALGEESGDDGWVEMGHRMTEVPQDGLHYGLGQDGTMTTPPTSSWNALARVA